MGGGFCVILGVIWGQFWDLKGDLGVSSVGFGGIFERFWGGSVGFGGGLGGFVADEWDLQPLRGLGATL